MVTLKKLLTGLTVSSGIAMAAVAAPAEAITLSGSTSGSWGDLPAGTFGVDLRSTYGETDNWLEWGTPAYYSYSNVLLYLGEEFDNVEVDQNTPSEIFQIGTVAYRNGAVYTGSHNFGIENGQPEPTPFALSVALDFDDIEVPDQAFDFDFELETIPNRWNPADDSLKFTSVDSSDTFSIDDIDYTLELFGFSQDEGLTATDVLVLEEDTVEYVAIYARIKTAPPERIPEPASLLGLLAVGSVGYRLKRQHAVQQSTHA